MRVRCISRARGDAVEGDLVAVLKKTDGYWVYLNKCTGGMGSRYLLKLNKHFLKKIHD